MWTRFKTAIILVMIVGVAVFASDTPYLFLSLLTLVAMIAAHEWAQLMPQWLMLQGSTLQGTRLQDSRLQGSALQPQPSQQHASLLYVGMVAVLSMVLLGLPLMWPQFGQLWAVGWAVALLLWLLALVWVMRYPQVSGWYGKRLAAIGMLMLTAAITAMFYLWQHSPWWLMYVLMLVWCADTGAYFVGRKLGKHKMSPRVSPNKSMEGLAGGLLTGLIVVMAISVFKLQLSGLSLIAFVLLSCLTILASVLGDLFESMLKRQAKVKDSGNILPGHGGVLDRIDSLLAAMPIFALGFWGLQQLQLLVLSA